jgi:hypothetical protein
MAGHVNQIRVEIAVNETNYSQKVYYSAIYFDYPESIAYLETETMILKKILKTGELKDIPCHMDRAFVKHKSNKVLKSKDNRFQYRGLD